MSTSSCVFCGENHMFKTMNVKIANGVIERCRNCGGYRLNPPHIVDYDDSGWSSMRKTDWQKDVERGRAYARKITKWYYSKTKKSLSSILEVGCGSAYMAPGFTENGVSYTGIDVDSASVEFAKSNAIDVHRVSAEELNKSPLAGKKYDLVLSSNALEHVNCPMKSFESIKECIGGLAIIIVPNPEGLLPMLKSNKLALNVIQKINNNKRNIAYTIDGYWHNIAYSKDTIKYLCNKVNLEIVDLSSISINDKNFGFVQPNHSVLYKLSSKISDIFDMNSQLMLVAK